MLPDHSFEDFIHACHIRDVVIRGKSLDDRADIDGPGQGIEISKVAHEKHGTLVESCES